MCDSCPSSCPCSLHTTGTLACHTVYKYTAPIMQARRKHTVTWHAVEWRAMVIQLPLLNPLCLAVHNYSLNSQLIYFPVSAELQHASECLTTRFLHQTHVCKSTLTRVWHGRHVYTAWCCSTCAAAVTAHSDFATCCELLSGCAELFDGLPGRYFFDMLCDAKRCSEQADSAGNGQHGMLLPPRHNFALQPTPAYMQRCF
jgi:hypothetical protein